MSEANPTVGDFDKRAAAALIAAAARHLERGELDALQSVCEQGLALHPGESEFDHLLGLALCRGGRRAEGLQRMRHAVAQQPDDPARRHNLAMALDDAGDSEAEAVLRENILRARDFAPSWYSLGNILMRRGDVAQAIDALIEATRAAPGDVQAWNNLGVASARLGRIDDAARAYERALGLSGSHPEALFNLASLYTGAARYAESPALWQRYLALRPAHAEAWHGLAISLYNCGDWTAATEAYRRTLALEPGNAMAMRGLAMALKYQGEISAAEALLFDALRLAPGNIEVLNTLGVTLIEKRRPDEAAAVFRRGLAIDPGRADLHSNLLLTMQYSEQSSADDMARERAQFEQRHGATAPRAARHDNVPDPQRRLRVGYVSADFRLHSCAYFFEPLLGAHNRSAFEIHCYSCVAHPDATTARLRAMADGWHDITTLTDEAAGAMIRAHGIDILVDMAGHTAGNRLAAFARKPAPVQVSWLGYPDDTGLHAIDARISDAITDPPGEASEHGDSTIIRLAAGAHCYAAPPPVPEVAPLPAVSNGFVTFGSFNNIAKVTPSTLRLWAALLREAPRSRLVLKHWQLADAPLRTELLRAFFMEGVAPDRIDTLPRIADQGGHLAAYHRIDIGLDTFPYHGTATTCEALWMGVPVLTLLGERPPARVGASLLTRVGLQSLIADSRERFVVIGAALAGDIEALARLRAELRERMRASPLGNPALWTPHLEGAYRELWTRWCR
jgi:predicted O-linked N-acetylglucosamine transferase (SPINDLY family)